MMVDLAKASSIAAHDLGEQQLRSVAMPVRLFSLAITAAADTGWIDPACKMHAPIGALPRRRARSGSARRVVPRRMHATLPPIRAETSGAGGIDERSVHRRETQEPLS